MPVTCEDCGNVTQRYVTKLVSSTGKFRSTCFICENPRHSGFASCHDPYADLTIDHVTTEDGKPLRVTSKRQLLEAEKRYNFRSLIAHTDEENFDKPPQQQTGTVADVMTRENRWMFPEIAKSQLAELKRKGISIADW